MNAVDPVAALLADVSRPVDPRPEFAQALLQQLLRELLPRQRVREPWRARRFDWLFPGLAPRVRLVLVVIVLLLLLAGIATATYLSVRTWVAGPGSVQVAGDYHLSVVYDQPSDATTYSGFTLGPGGHDLYGYRQRYGARPTTTLERIRDIDSALPSRPERLLELGDLAKPGLWGPGVDVRHDNFSGWDAAAVSADGDVFLSATAWTPRGQREDIALIVLRPGERPRTVLTLAELRHSTVLPRSGDPTRLAVAAMGPDRLWLLATIAHRRYSVPALVEVIDPNADGAWSDRVVRRIALPRSLSGVGRQPYVDFPQLVVDPSGPRSVLVMALSDEFHLFRVTDRNADGDFVDPGEVRLLLHGHGPPKGWPAVALKSATRAGDARLDLAITGLERYDRLSLVSSSGRVTDVVRSLPDQTVWTPLAASNGNVYVVGGGTRLRAYRLSIGTGGQQATAVRPRLSQTPFPPASADARLLLWTAGGSYWARADGTVVGRLAPETSQWACQSTDGRALAYWSDAEAPGEDFLYVADSAGKATKVTERLVDVLCPFAKRWLVLADHGTLVRHDLRTGRDEALAHSVEWSSVSPDANRVVYVDRFRGARAALAVADLRTLDHRRLAGPPLLLTGRPFFGGLKWSPRGSRIAYMTRPGRYGQHAGPPDRWPPRATDLWVQNMTSGRRERVLRVVGSPASFSWSPDGKRLLACVEERGTRTGCSGTHAPGGNEGRLLLVGARGGPARVIATGELVYAAWAPSGNEFAYATPTALYVRPVDGPVRRVANAPARGWPAWYFDWLGWSPDGRFIGYSREGANGVSVVDARTGRTRIIRGPSRKGLFRSEWWRSPTRRKPSKGG